MKTYLISIMIKLFIVLVFCFSSYAAPIPEDRRGNEYGVDIRFFKKWQKHTLLFEHVKRDELEGINYNRFNVGDYFRPHRNLKFGLFLWREQGVRQDEDWQKINNVWQWKNVNKKVDYSLVFDLTPVFETPLENLVFEWKNRLVHNLENGKNLLRTRPGLTYILFKNDKPIINLFNQYEFYYPLDYGRKTLYETWIYLGGLYHFSKTFLAGPYYSRRTRYWTNPDSFSQNFGNEYLNKFNSHFYGLAFDILF
jgi:hypothetical protein